MQLNVRALSLATAGVSASLYLICAFGVALAPELATRIASDVMHIDAGSITRSVTWGGGLVGLITGTLVTTVFAWAVASLYNRLAVR